MHQKQTVTAVWNVFVGIKASLWERWAAGITFHTHGGFLRGSEPVV